MTGLREMTVLNPIIETVETHEDRLTGTSADSSQVNKLSIATHERLGTNEGTITSLKASSLV